MTKVKICGITNLEDARHAANSGADALGFNFYEGSPRYIQPALAASIIQQLNGETLNIGVFVNEDLDNVSTIALSIGLDAVQLHGDEDPAYVEECNLRSGLPVIKVFRVGSSFSMGELTRYRPDAILLDTLSENGIGGTGKVFNWATAAKITGFFPKVYLAGGLSPENVGDAIRLVRPYAVDACSLLENAPGRKDSDKIGRFIVAAKEAL